MFHLKSQLSVRNQKIECWLALMISTLEYSLDLMKFMSIFEDITSKLGTPEWWDECRVPRYCDFDPKLVNDIYAKEVVFSEVLCQQCGHLFKVAISTNSLSKYSLKDGVPCYGDPPNFQHHRECYAGTTMTSIMQKVIEFWERDGTTNEFKRLKEFEREFQ